MGKISIPDSCTVPFLILIDHSCHMLHTQFQPAPSAALILAGVQNRLSALQEQNMGGEKRLALREQALLCCSSELFFKSLIGVSSHGYI